MATPADKKRYFGCRLWHGFTVLELIMAIAILAVVATVAMASYERYVERGRVYRAVQDIGHMQTVISQFALDNNYRYPDSLAEIGKAGTLDPWGRPYVYTNLTDVKDKGKARKDKRLNPINSDFDLYSVGKDGATATPLTAKASHDDVVRAGDGRFIGLGKDF